MTLCDRVIVLIMSGKLSFHDRKSREILLQKTRRTPCFHLVEASSSKTKRYRNPEISVNVCQGRGDDFSVARLVVIVAWFSGQVHA